MPDTARTKPGRTAREVANVILETNPALELRPTPRLMLFDVGGIPVPQGSMTAYVVNGRANVTSKNRATLGAWRQQIAASCREVLEEPISGPLAVELVFTLARPKSHYRTGKRAGELKESAPSSCSSRPDIDKLVRAALDALTGVAYADDAQVARLLAHKHYGALPGLRVTLQPLGGSS